MTVIAHISDLHFGRESSPCVDGLLSCLTQMEPQLVVISGDLTQRARKREYLAAATFLENLSWPYVVIPGNHDISAYNLVERFFFPWEKWQRYIGKTLEPTTTAEEYVVAGINTVRRSGALLDWSRGRINIGQILGMTEFFNNCEKKKLRVLVAHHPFWLPEAYRHRHLVGRRDLAMNAVVKAGIDIILSGHVHFAYTHLEKGIIISHAGTAISDRLTANNKNSFNIICGNKKRLSFETWEWDSSKFILAETRVFLHIRGSWVGDS